MKACILCTLVGLLAAAGHWAGAFAQQSCIEDGLTEPASVLESAAGTHRDTEASADSGSANQDDDAEREALRQELLLLTEDAASRMELEELQTAVEQARQRARNAAANEQIAQIRQQLNELIEQYPETEAAYKAELMLNIRQPARSSSNPFSGASAPVVQEI